jgi:hypothetical protein
MIMYYQIWFTKDKTIISSFAIKKSLLFLYSAAASGWAGWTGWALAHLKFESSVNPITTRGSDYAHHITASPSGFENPAASLLYVVISEPG